MIHKTAIISEASEIADNVEIGPYSIIGPKVKIDNNTKIHSHVSIIGDTFIGTGNEIFPFASIGTPPQDLKYKGEKNSIVIGNNNKLREYVNINPGTEQGGGVTKIGNNNWIGANSVISNQLSIKNNTHISMGSVLFENLDNNFSYINNRILKDRKRFIN